MRSQRIIAVDASQKLSSPVRSVAWLDGPWALGMVAMVCRDTMSHFFVQPDHPINKDCGRAGQVREMSLESM